MRERVAGKGPGLGLGKLGCQPDTALGAPRLDDLAAIGGGAAGAEAVGTRTLQAAGLERLLHVGNLGRWLKIDAAAVRVFGGEELCGKRGNEQTRPDRSPWVPVAEGSVKKGSEL